MKSIVEWRTSCKRHVSKSNNNISKISGAEAGETKGCDSGNACVVKAAGKRRRKGWSWSRDGQGEKVEEVEEEKVDRLEAAVRGNLGEVEYEYEN